MGHAAELVGSSNNFPLNQSEDFGESVRRISSNSPTHVTGSEYKKEGSSLGAAELVGRETQSPQPEAGASTPGFEPYISAVSVERQKQRLSVDTIDELFDFV